MSPSVLLYHPPRCVVPIGDHPSLPMGRRWGTPWGPGRFRDLRSSLGEPSLFCWSSRLSLDTPVPAAGGIASASCSPYVGPSALSRPLLAEGLAAYPSLT